MSVFRFVIDRFRRRGAPRPFAALEERIGYRFRDPALLERALTHRSHAVDRHNDLLRSNERFEFLGDAVLGHAVSEFLFRRFPDRREGDLSRVKSALISRKALKYAADTIGLSRHLLLSRSEEKTGGRDRFSINTNAFEALVAAVYLDGGFEASRAFIERHVQPLLTTVQEDESYVNYKSRLLERVQSDSDDAPRYTVTAENGPDHAKVFEVAVSFGGRPRGTGSGKSKKEAEQAAARSALENLEE